MAKPFTSHDGVDSTGVRAEVHVQTGTGTVKELSENGKNVLVKMQVEGLKHPVQGWTSTSESIYEILTQAKESGREVSYRIESQRKNGVARNIPIAELRKTQETANENTRSLFVGVDGTLSSEAVTDPAEDPHTGGRIPATDPRNKPASASPAAGTPGGFSVEQALTGLANARQGGLPQSIVDATAALALAAGASVQQVMSAGVNEQQAETPRQVQRAIAAEAAPHIANNTDGRLNLGSYKVQAAVGAESLATDLLNAHAVAVAEKHNAQVLAQRENGDDSGDLVEVQPVNYRQAAALGGVLLGLADDVQVAAYGGGRPNRMASSHTRCRALVYDAVKNRYPVPFGESPERQEGWKKQITDEAVERFLNAIRLAAGDTDAPAQQEVSREEQQTQQDQPSTPANSAPEAPAEVPAEAPAGTPAVDVAGEDAQAPTAAEADPATGSPAAQVRQIGNAEAKPKPPVEGEDGFVAPDAEVLTRFGALAISAGFEPKPDSPVSVYLNHKFGVATARKVHAPALSALVNWYEQQGATGAGQFRQHVLTEAQGEAAASA